MWKAWEGKEKTLKSAVVSVKAVLNIEKLFRVGKVGKGIFKVLIPTSMLVIQRL